MQSIAMVVMIYGLLVLIGGFIGWATAKSKPSLWAGVVFGLALQGCGAAIWAGWKEARLAALALAAVLLVFFAARYVATKKLMPAGLMAILSLVVVAIVAVALRE